MRSVASSLATLHARPVAAASACDRVVSSKQETAVIQQFHARMEAVYD